MQEEFLWENSWGFVVKWLMLEETLLGVGNDNVRNLQTPYEEALHNLCSGQTAVK
jgi:hypothetical protein